MEADDTYRIRHNPNRRPRKIKGAGLFYELLSPTETAKIMGLTRQRVAQIEKSALLKLRIGLKDFWNDWQ